VVKIFSPKKRETPKNTADQKKNSIDGVKEEPEGLQQIVKYDHQHPLGRGFFGVTLSLGLLQCPVDAAVILEPEDEYPLDELADKPGEGLDDLPEEGFHLPGPFLPDDLGRQGDQIGHFHEKGRQKIAQDHLEGKTPSTDQTHEPADDEKINIRVARVETGCLAVGHPEGQPDKTSQAKTHPQAQADSLEKKKN
jgi:hypothetical protein